jgi:hypothetical protein
MGADDRGAGADGAASGGLVWLVAALIIHVVRRQGANSSE